MVKMPQIADHKFRDELKFMLEEGEGKSRGSTYWAAYSQNSIPYLLRNGFTNFRSAEFKIGISSGNVLPPDIRQNPSSTLFGKLTRKLFSRSIQIGVDVDQVNGRFKALFDAFALSFCRYLEKVDDPAGNIDLLAEDAPVGNPSDSIITSNGRQVSVLRWTGKIEQVAKRASRS